MKVFIMSFIKKMRLLAMLFFGLQLNSLKASDDEFSDDEFEKEIGAFEQSASHAAHYSDLAERFDVLRQAGQDLPIFQNFMQDQLANIDTNADDNAIFVNATKQAEQMILTGQKHLYLKKPDLKDSFEGVDHVLWSKDISDPYWRVQKAVIDRARGSQLQSILDLKRPKGYSDEAWNILRNSANNSLLNNEVVYTPKQIYQAEVVDVSEQINRFELEDISVAELANNAVKMYPQLAEGFKVLRQSGEQGLPSFHDFIEQELADDDTNFGIEIEKAQDIIFAEMKDRLFQFLHTAVEKQKIERASRNRGINSFNGDQDPVFQYVLKYSIGVKQPDGSFSSNKAFMMPGAMNWQDDTGMTLLHFAAMLNLADIVNLLIDAGVSIDIKDSSSITPLYYAVFMNADRVVPLLLAGGAAVNEGEDSQETLLHVAAAGDADKVVSLLLATGATVDVRNNIQETPLHYAAENDASDVVSLLLAAGATVDAKTDLEETPLHYAAKYNAHAVARLLLKAGANVNARNKFEETPLHYAAENNAYKVVPLLLAARASINAVNNSQETPLNLAAENGADEAAQLLLAAGANMTIINNHG